MKLLWLCNMVPGAVKKAITGKEGNGLWVDHVLQDLRRQDDLEIRILCPYKKEKSGNLDNWCSYRTFRTKLPHQYLPELEEQFAAELNEFQPDVIHSWGVEYAHTLAMVNAAEKAGCLNKMAVSIQGLCGFIAGPLWAAVVGLIAPVLRFALFGMPPLFPTGAAMCVELAVYGLVSGCLYARLPRKAWSLYASLLSAMLLGRVAWGIVRVVFSGLSGSAFTWAAFIAGAFTSAIPGIILHIVLIPVIVLALNRALPWLKNVR